MRARISGARKTKPEREFGIERGSFSCTNLLTIYMRAKVAWARRLDPMERVCELGDASVPFSFDERAPVRGCSARVACRRVDRKACGNVPASLKAAVVEEYGKEMIVPGVTICKVDGDSE